MGQKMIKNITIYGAGAIGGWLGARLAGVGCSVSVVARGATLAALQQDGLQLVEAEGTTPPHGARQQRPGGAGRARPRHHRRQSPGTAGGGPPHRSVDRARHHRVDRHERRALVVF
jgi:choline dehydrogenase-like flavoprotein